MKPDGHIEAAPFDLATTRDWWLVPRRLFDGEGLTDSRAIRITDRRVVSVVSAEAAGRDGAPVWRTSRLAVPGFFDTQINGGGGVLFNADPSLDGLATIAAAHRSTGTTSWLPTLITDVADRMDQGADAAIATHRRFGIVGIHLEGPHISIARKGAHRPDLIRPFDERTVATVARLREAGLPVLLTLAPECVPPGTIARLCRMGAVVSLGHTDADFDAARAAIAEGARSATHLYNAMTPITSRSPGVVGAVLDSDIYCGFIADGHHVDDTTLRLAIRSRPVADRMVLVSDAMPTWNGPPVYELLGETIRLQDGKLVNRIGSLAGVHIDMASSLRRLVQAVGIGLEDSLKMATANPARLMGLDQEIGYIRAGAKADIVLLDEALVPGAIISSSAA
ncbi:N-acetylglucosamine-6-phosphate deacetylase [Rhizobium sp. TH2]|uniref:N-acetylglucosamine-6-phosphate deacetylase n=1 Tax=Rhizobium sp. TH2 TaxID=2775403 RepID=UPI0021573675|nr:N-acetylglucosamine-6-phosphate deacetylase [Rhizobium sp. TH2]UVC09461.1 N-acetylglucosamine-6-phosphate deacetylase [Rhizobium sp. TH2]